MEQNSLDNLAPSGKKRATGWQRDVVIFLDRLILGFARHWMVLVAILTGIYVGLPFVAPVAMHYGQTGVANVIYTVYGPPVCHQMAFRTWFLFGQQIAYPRELAGVPGLTFEEVARRDPAFADVDVNTLDAMLIYAAKDFRGNTQMGWKVALCERDVAIYGSIALFGLVFASLRKLKIKVPYLPFWLYLLIAIAPVGLDGFSQMFANPPFNGFGLAFYPIRESTPFLRTLTGALFGMGNAWLAFPYIDDSMAETRIIIEAKLARAGLIEQPKTEIPGQILT